MERSLPLMGKRYTQQECGKEKHRGLFTHTGPGRERPTASCCSLCCHPPRTRTAPQTPAITTVLPATFSRVEVKSPKGFCEDECVKYPYQRQHRDDTFALFWQHYQRPSSSTTCYYPSPLRKQTKDNESNLKHNSATLLLQVRVSRGPRI